MTILPWAFGNRPTAGELLSRAAVSPCIADSLLWKNRVLAMTTGRPITRPAPPGSYEYHCTSRHPWLSCEAYLDTTVAGGQRKSRHSPADDFAVAAAANRAVAGC